MKEYIKNAHVVCDKCGWTKAVEHKEIPSWHNIKCPQCKDSIIVNDNDLKVYNLMALVSDIQNAMGLPDDAPMIKVRISTAP